MKRRESIKLILKIFLIVFFVVTLGVGFFCYSVVSHINIDKIANSAPPREMEREVTDALDQGVFLKKDLIGLYYTWSESSNSFDLMVKDRLNQGSFERKRDGIFTTEKVPLPELKSNDCEIVYCLQSRLSFEEIPSLLWRGLIGIEDYRFLDHAGVDPRSLARALWHDIKVLKLEQGGSTLTQQLVKNLFYTNERKFSRKIKEMIASTYIELKLKKEQILQAYFNEVVWGSFQGIKIKGVAAAALFYFGKKPMELTPFEASILIGLLKGPYYYSPLSHRDRLEKRASVVFEKLKELRLFPENAHKWDQSEWERWGKAIKETAQKTHLRSLYILSKKERKEQTFSNYVLLNEVESLDKELKKKYNKSDFAIKVVRYRLDAEKQDPVFSHYSKYERSLERAINSEMHQVGSTLKPIIYGLLNIHGLSMQDEVETGVLNLKLTSGVWSPREAHSGLEPKVSYHTALIQSLNRPVIRAVQNFGFEKFETILSEKIPRLKTPLAEYPAQLLGSVELSLSELATVFGGFLRKACWEGFGAEVLNALSDPKTTTIRYRVGEKLGQMNFFGKTGTSNNGYDNWFVGFDGRELLITWVGLEGDRTKNKEFRLYGSNTAFLIFRNYYQKRGKLFNEMACQDSISIAK